MEEGNALSFGPMAEYGKAMSERGAAMMRGAQADWEARKAAPQKGAETAAEEANRPHTVFDAQGNSRTIAGQDWVNYQNTGLVGGVQMFPAAPPGVVKGAETAAEQAAMPHTVIGDDGSSQTLTGQAWVNYTKTGLVDGKRMYPEIPPAAAAAKAGAVKGAEEGAVPRMIYDNQGVAHWVLGGPSGAGLGAGAAEKPPAAAVAQKGAEAGAEVTGKAAAEGAPGVRESETLTAVQPEAAKALWAEQRTMSDQYDQRQVARQRLHDIQGIMQALQTGTWATEKADIQAKLRAIGIDTPDTSTWNAAMVQRFSKDAQANVFDQVKAVGGRPMVAEISGLKAANANPELQPAANARITAQGLGILDRADKHFEDFTAWHQQHPTAYDTSEFEKAWKKENPLENFVNAEEKAFGYQGQYIPNDPSNRVDGQTYMTPKGLRVWDSAAGGWRKP
jgi:hypothetical protein